VIHIWRKRFPWKRNVAVKSDELSVRICDDEGCGGWRLVVCQVFWTLISGIGDWKLDTQQVGGSD
jgi:hypothetical protein